jgi:protein TonB
MSFFTGHAVPSRAQRKCHRANSLIEQPPKLGSRDRRGRGKSFAHLPTQLGRRSRASVCAEPTLEQMSETSQPLPDVYSVREIARAASVDVPDVRALLDSGQVTPVDGEFITGPEAVRAVRLLAGRANEALRPRPLLALHRPSRVGTVPFAVSTLLHGAVVVLVLLTAFGLRDTVTEAHVRPLPAHLVFLAVPGPGGGGGGGGVRRPQPPARAELKGTSALRSPVRTEPRRPKEEPRPKPPRPPDPKPVEKPPDVPVVETAPPVPPVAAPVAPVPAETRDQAGVPEAPASTPPNQGSGSDGGSGSGAGTGMGEGKGPGVGAGEGGGTGGGPFRPGSGIAPPGLLREVKPQYTEEARRAGVEGDVVLEIVVRADGTVGNVTILRSLGAGLDRRAVDAVRQWRFSPARRFGTPVDVLVEVAVEFKLR